MLYYICIYHIIYVYYSPTFAVQNDLNLAKPKWSLLQDGTGGDHLPRSMRSSEPRCVPAWPLPSGGLTRRCTALDPWSVTPFPCWKWRYSRYSPFFTWDIWDIHLMALSFCITTCCHFVCRLPQTSPVRDSRRANSGRWWRVMNQLWSSRVSFSSRNGFVTQHLQTLKTLSLGPEISSNLVMFSMKDHLFGESWTRAKNWPWICSYHTSVLPDRSPKEIGFHIFDSLTWKLGDDYKTQNRLMIKWWFHPLFHHFYTHHSIDHVINQ